MSPSKRKENAQVRKRQQIIFGESKPWTKKNNMCSSGYTPYLKILPLTRNDFILLFSSSFIIWRKIHIKMTIRNGNLNLYAFILWYWSKRIKTRLYLQTRPFFISVLSYLIHFQADLSIQRKKFSKENSIVPTNPYFFMV